jgi:hypothetical protein
VSQALAIAARPSGRHLAELRPDEVDALAHAELVGSDGGHGWRWTSDRSSGRPLWPVAHAAASC